jgi:DNA-directed RNA polymerase specialized sigma24 family protein
MVEMCYFGGFTETEVAGAMSVSRSTVARELRSAKAWLYRRMTSGRPQEST